MRLFTAISVPTELREGIILDTSFLRGRYPRLKWIGTEGLHITLNFFGEVEEKYIPLIESAMSTAAGGVSSVSFRVKSLELYRSHLKSKGAEYEVLKSVEMGDLKG